MTSPFPKPSSAVLLLLFFALLSTASVQADSGKAKEKTGKPAWQWTLDERLTKRFDPEERRARTAVKIAEDAALQKSWGAKGGSEPLEGTADLAEPSHRQDLDVISGRRNPELFLPVELFSHLLAGAFPPGGLDGGDYKGIIEERAAALGFGRDLWVHLHQIAAPVLELERKQEEWARKNPVAYHAKVGKVMDDEDRALCRARAEALEKAEDEFGKEPFLRLLYEVVAPSTEMSYSPNEGIADQKRFLEGGCR